MMNYRELHSRLNGRITAGRESFSYEDANPQKGSNHWSSTENNRNNARNVNFNNGNANNNNKYNSNVVRPVTAFDDVVPPSFLESVWEAYHDCLRGKMNSTQALEYMQIADADIPVLARELWTVTYKPGTSTCFLVRYPKWREVFAANFRDRIVHHWVCLRLEPLFEYRFREQGDLSFNCRKGYGTEKAVEHLAAAMSRVSDNYRNPAWVFRGDLVGFFMSIDKDLLWYLLERFIKRWRHRIEVQGKENPAGDIDMYWDILLRATEVIVMHHPEKDCVLNSDAYLWEEHMAANKSLFTSPTGEPIGNLTTQLFANFLMSFFVAYVKFLFRRKNWGMAQFVDDFAIVCDDLPFLVRSVPLLSAFLLKLRLTMHKDKRYLQPVSHGILFVGTFIKPGRLYLSGRTLARFQERCEGYGRLLDEGECDVIRLQRIEQVLNSYFGFCTRRQTYNYRCSLIERLGANFWKYYYVNGSYHNIRLRRKYRMLN
ncbi:MAG: reverse transcriptase [Bacteroidaceae bacterium]|nr:reverse transcriptase [Bacteroidaceae bacterium]